MKEIISDFLIKINVYETIIAVIILIFLGYLGRKLLIFFKTLPQTLEKLKKWYRKRYKYELSATDKLIIMRTTGKKLSGWEKRARKRIEQNNSTSNMRDSGIHKDE